MEDGDFFVTDGTQILETAACGPPFICVCLCLLLPQHLFALGFEFRAGIPHGKFVAVGDLVADREEELRVFHCPFEIPFRIHFVGRLVVMLGDVFVSFLFPKPGLPMMSVPLPG